MSREAIIRQIVHRDLEQLGLTEEIVREEAVELYEAACDHFGTWETALTYAGINVRRMQPRKEYTADRVLQEIRTLCISGYDLSATHNLKRDRRLYEAARQHFGTWSKALAATGLNLKHAFHGGRPRKLDRQKLLEAIKQRQESGETLVWTDVCLENRGFASAAKRVFGSWRSALIAAGIDPAMHHIHGTKVWDQQRVIDCLRQRQQEGKSLKCADVRREHCSLANAAYRYFGNWTNAIRVVESER
jgi:hypothetical protein